MGGGQEETQGGGDLAPITLWLPLAPDLRGRLSRVFALTQGSPTSCWLLHPPSPYPFHRLHGPHPGGQGQGWTWAGAGLSRSHGPAHIPRDTLPSKILLPGLFQAFPQATPPGPAPCSLYGPSQGSAPRLYDSRCPGRVLHIGSAHAPPLRWNALMPTCSHTCT